MEGRTTATVNLKTTPGAAELLKISGGGLSHMVDFVGAPATSQLALPALLKGGQLVVVGLFGGALPVPLPALAMREISLRGSAVGTTAQRSGNWCSWCATADSSCPQCRCALSPSPRPHCVIWRPAGSSAASCWTPPKSRPERTRARRQNPGFSLTDAYGLGPHGADSRIWLLCVLTRGRS